MGASSRPGQKRPADEAGMGLNPVGMGMGMGGMMAMDNSFNPQQLNNNQGQGMMGGIDNRHWQRSTRTKFIAGQYARRIHVNAGYVVRISSTDWDCA